MPEIKLIFRKVEGVQHIFYWIFRNFSEWLFIKHLRMETFTKNR